ncbi:hypothetical protein [Olleya sp. UBA1516]|uniref:hypothetical protein n=1 Tax=Olleya sp. UBA1516 TaxID=1947013 RepID=UPI0025F551CD|nr:hypothetical protein [Olleya sp. UBA1516]
MFTLSETEIKNDKRLINKIDKFQTDIKTKNNSSSSSRYIYTAENQFTVNTDYAIHIDNGANSTYTFPMYRQQDYGLLENLLLVEQEDDSFKVYIVQYEFTEEEIAAINFRESVDFENKVTFIEINDDGLTDDIFGKYFYNGNCYEDNMVYQPGSNCTAGGLHSVSDGAYNEYTNPDGCKAWNTSSMATSGGYVFMPTLVSCDGQGGNTTGSGPDVNTNNHGGLTGSASTTPITCRVDCLPDSDALESCDLTVPVSFASLSLIDQEICWLNKSGQSTIKANLETYLNNSGDLDFGQLAFDTLYNGGEVDFEEELILDSDLKANNCLYSVYTGMGNAPTFANYLNNFDGDMSVAHLKLTSSTTLPSNTNAETSAPQNYLITITFNENNLNRPNLSIARTFIHEIIHAEIFRKLLSAANQPNLNYSEYTDEEWRDFIISLRNNFEGIYDYYLRWKWDVPAGQNPSSAQHEAMAQHYRDIIKQALQEFDSSQTDEIYEALAWTGLMGSGTFNPTTGLYSNSTVAWANKSQEYRLSILSTLDTFYYFNSNCSD